MYQPGVTSKHYGGINPYALGFAMMRDIRRVCENPTDEDRAWFRDQGIAGSDWKKTLDFAMRNFKDESFIAQYLSPKLMRDFHLFAIVDDDNDTKLEISAIHDDEGYRYIREKLAAQYNLGNREPDIQVVRVDVKGDRSLTLQFTPRDRHRLDDDSTEEVLKHAARLWGFNVDLRYPDDGFICSVEASDEE